MSSKGFPLDPHCTWYKWPQSKRWSTISWHRKSTSSTDFPGQVRMATTQIAFHPQAAVRWIFVTFHPFVMAAQKLFGHFAKNFKALKYWQTASNCCEMGARKLDWNILFILAMWPQGNVLVTETSHLNLWGTFSLWHKSEQPWPHARGAPQISPQSVKSFGSLTYEVRKN